MVPFSNADVGRNFRVCQCASGRLRLGKSERKFYAPLFCRIFKTHQTRLWRNTSETIREYLPKWLKMKLWYEYMRMFVDLSKCQKATILLLLYSAKDPWSSVGSCAATQDTRSGHEDLFSFEKDTTPIPFERDARNCCSAKQRSSF